MSEKEIIKKFLNEKNGRMYSSLKTAKESTKSPYISRVWIKDEKIIGKQVVFAYGEGCCTVRRADEIIAEKIQNV